MAHRVTLIPGDGIGPEVAEAARLVLDATDVGIEWIERAAGAGALGRDGDLLPEATLEAIRRHARRDQGPDHDAGGHRVPQRERGAAPGARPVRGGPAGAGLPGVPTRHRDVDLVVIRENTEDLYQGIEFERGSREARALREELARALGRVRDPRGRRHHREADLRRRARGGSCASRSTTRGGTAASTVTVGHKANVMRFSDGLFLRDRARGGREPPRRRVRGDPDRPPLDAARAPSPGTSTCCCCRTSTATSSATCARASSAGSA